MVLPTSPTDRGSPGFERKHQLARPHGGPRLGLGGDHRSEAFEQFNNFRRVKALGGACVEERVLTTAAVVEVQPFQPDGERRTGRYLLTEGRFKAQHVEASF